MRVGTSYLVNFSKIFSDGFLPSSKKTKLCDFMLSFLS
jgi:hypothetical protein